MNKNRFRIVFNAARGLRMAVAECAHSFGKASTTVCAAVSLFASPLFAQIVADPSAPSGQRPTVLVAPNGVPLVNIQTPSAAGVSRNTYSQFDVNAQGAILNNSRTNVQTQLGGWVQGNPWLATGGARVILNEVNSANPSHLRGFVEVAGQRAEVIIANPAGIHVNGGGFINASRAMLTTGTPIMNGGALDGYRVQRGSVSVGGAGLDARLTDHTAILARAIEVNAGIWANDLQLVTGANDIGADQTTVQAQPASGTPPAFALDVANLGGMYAGKITLVGTEAGLGVRNAGTIGASAGDVVIDANGWLSNKGSLQASANLSIHLRGELHNEKDIYAGGVLNIQTQQAVTNSGQINAEGNVLVQAAATENRVGARIASNAGIEVRSSGAQLNQGVIVSAGSLRLQAAQLDNEGRLLSTAGDMRIISQGAVSNTGPAAQMYAAGQQHIQASGTLTNSGLIAAAGDLTVQAGSVHGTGTLAAGLNTDGSLNAAAARLDIQVEQQLTAKGNNLASGHLRLEGRALDISDSQTRAQTLNLNATGRGAQAAPGIGLIDAHNADVLAYGNVEIDGQALKTTDAQLQALGDIDIEVTQLDNQGGLIRSGGSLTATATRIDNRDTRTAAGSAPLGVIAQSIHITTGDLLNQSGAIVAAEALTVTSAGTGSHQIENSRGLLSAGTTLDMHEATTASPTAARHLSITNTAGTLIADARLAITAKSLSLDGEVLSQQDMALSVQGDHTHAQGSRIVANRDLTLDIEDGGLRNSGALLAGRNLGFTATSLENTTTGEISAGTTTDIEVTEALINRGLVDGKNTRLRAQDLNNIGTGRIYGDALAIQATSLLNDTETVGSVRSDAVIAARERLDIGVQTLINREGATIFSAGDMAIGGALDANHRADGATSGMAQSILNQSATIEALGSLAIATQTLANTNEHFTYTVVPEGATAKTDYYTAYGYMSSPQDVAWSVTEYDGPPEYRDVTVSGTKILPKTSAYANPAFRDFYQGPTPFVEGHTVWFDAGDSGYSTWVPDAYGHDRDSPLWAALGMTAPAWNNPGQKPRTVYATDDSGQSFPPDPQALADWEAKIAPWLELTARFIAFKGTVASQLIPTNLFRQYTETAQRAEVTSSSPARIVSGTSMDLKIGQNAFNRNSHIVAGGNLNVNGAAVNNEATQVDAPTLRSGTLSQWTVVGQRCSSVFGCEPVYDWANAAYAESITRTVSLPSIRYESNASSGQAPLTIGALRAASTGSAAATASASSDGAVGAPPVSIASLPTSSLFTLHPQSTSRFLVETDPRFTNHRQWLSSDYMLAALSIDPATTQKRLGDGFYEQKLVREQIAALTGLRFLGDFTSDEQQYQSLMTTGATFAQAHQLRPGIALSAEMVAQLTSDIVWLVSESVMLPDGSTTQVLVPKVYVLPREGDLTATGALLAGQTVNLNLSGDLINAGTISGRQVTQITAANVRNLGGQLGGGKTTQITALQDVHNIGGSISAQEELRLDAGRDINIHTAASQGRGDTGEGQYSSQGIDRVAGLYVSHAAGVLVASAGRDVNLTAALLKSAGSVQVDATDDIRLGTVNTATSMDATRDERNFTRIEHAGEVGTQIQAGAGINLQAGQDIQARAANLQAGGELSMQADRDVSITAGEQSLSIDTAAFAKGSSALSSGSTEIREQRSDTIALSSSLGGERVSVRSGQDTTIHGSSVIGDEGTTVQAGGDVNIVAAQTTSSASRFEEHKSSGFSFSGSSISYGSQQQSTDQENQGTGSVASTVGAIAGNVSITAGQTYTQVGSDVMAPGGDITIAAQNVQIVEARETRSSEIEQKFEQSGFTLALSTPMLTAIQTISNQMEAAGDTKDGRMQGLAAANSAFAANNALNQMKEGESKTDASAAQQAGGVNFSLSFGSSSSESKRLETSDTARGSSLSASGNVSITASGAGENSNIIIQGSEVSAGGNATLNAEGDVNLMAAQNTASLTGSNKSDSGSVGISFGTGGIGVSASASSARGKEAGDDLIHTNTHITAGNVVRIQSGGDTTLQGTLVKAETIQAEVGGNLLIESLQDTSTYDSQQKSASASVTIGVGASGSFSASKSNVNSDFSSVAEQSGFKAGDGGFQVNVQGNTDLIGGAIASNQAAEEHGLNTFNTGGTLTLSDIQNKAGYSANSTSVGVGGGVEGNKKGMNGVGVGVGSDSGNASSTTTAGISGIAGDTAIRSTDAETGIQRIFEKERVQKEIEAQVKITEMFGREASKAIGDHAAVQMKQADSLRAQANAETDPDKRAQLNAQADQLEAAWGDNGTLRLLAHTVVGGLTGGASGAAGAATGTLAAPAVADAFASAGIDGALASTLTAIASTAVGVTAGGTAGGAAALNEVANNYLKHTDVQKLSTQLKACGTDQACRDKAFEEAYRVSVSNDFALLNCRSTANCDALKTEFRQGYEAIGKMLDAGIKPDDVSLVLNLETNAQTIIRNGLDQIQCNTPACKDKANHLVGIGKGLTKITPAGLVTGSGVMAYELTTALLNIGLADTAMAVANGVAGLPADIQNRLNSSDPQVRGEALVDALSLGAVATAVTAKMGQLGYTAVVKQVEAKAAKAAEADAIAKARIDNNFYAEGASSLPVGLQTSAGVIAANPNKTTTVLGRWQTDMKSVIEGQTHALKSEDFGARPGGFNVLNVSKATEDAAGSQFFEKVNKPFLDEAVKRGDDIALATVPLQIDDVISSTGALKGSFARELDYLVKHNYKPSNVTTQQWNNIRDWLK